jgi:hypothetical protein
MMNRLRLIFVVLALCLGFTFSRADKVSAAVNCSDPGVICRNGTLASDETWTPANIYVIV